MLRLLQAGLALNLLLTLLSIVLIFLGSWRAAIGPTILFGLFAFFCWQRLRQLRRSEA